MLNCMVTCRSTGKKPCDNNLIEPVITKLADSTISNTLGGDSITKAVKRQNNILDTFDEFTEFASLAKAASAFMVEPAGSGKVLAPLSGN